MFVNLTNHPSERWSIEQREAAEEYGKIVDIPFPNISPQADEEDLIQLVDEYYEKIQELNDNQIVVLIQGEMTFTYRMVEKLKSVGLKSVAGCSDRVTKEIVKDDGTTEKTSVFQFIKFREY